MGPGMDEPAVVDDPRPRSVRRVRPGPWRGRQVMKYLDEYRDPVLARKLMAEIHRVTTRPWTLMEVCGGQTHTIVKQGIDEMLPGGRAHDPRPRLPGVRDAPGAGGQGARHRGAPGRHLHQLRRHAAGARHPARTCWRSRRAARTCASSTRRSMPCASRAPTPTARWCSSRSASRPRRRPTPWPSLRPLAAGLDNFSVLVSHVLVPPAMTALLESPSNQVQAFLAAGHVCAVMGWTEYEPIAARYQVPIVVTGFEPLDLLEGILMAIVQLEEGRAEVENQYVRAVTRDGNRLARETVLVRVRGRRADLARHRPHPRLGLSAAPGLRALRRGTQVPGRGHPHPGAPGLHRRRHPDR